MTYIKDCQYNFYKKIKKYSKRYIKQPLYDVYNNCKI